MTFKVNNDLDDIKATWHNKFHFVVSMLMAWILVHVFMWFLVDQIPFTWALIVSGFTAFSITWTIWHLWDVGDGFKPWWSKCTEKPWIIQQLCCCDG